MFISSDGALLWKLRGFSETISFLVFYFLRLENRLVYHYFAFSKSGFCGYAGALAFRSKFSKLVFCLEKFLSFSKMDFPKSCVFGKQSCLSGRGRTTWRKLKMRRSPHDVVAVDARCGP